MATDNESWYAVKIYAEKASIMKYLADRHIETYIPMLNGKPLLGSIGFVHCTEKAVLRAKEDWFRQMMVYRDAVREKPQAIPDAEMANFRMVLSLQGQELIPLEVYDRHFLEGQKVRVKDGPLAGAIGVIKRIKGDRRLIVSITGVAAVATTFVHPEMLEPAEN